MRTLFFLLFAFLFYSCNQPVIKIEDFSKTQVGGNAANELTIYLNKLYSNATFSPTSQGELSDIQLMLSPHGIQAGFPMDQVPEKPESFKIVHADDKLLIIAPDERGLLNGTYVLLEKLGCGFYISGDVMPKQKKWKGFDGWAMEDEPLTGDRFVFNWHNFLSGCTGWNLPDWQLWIDQANKMRYNGIMVHAYGNNPMFSFEYLGEKKATGYLNNTSSGRDWGNQHVNDVCRMVGGEVFNQAVYGAQASMASKDNKEKQATELMQQVFQYAEDRGTNVIFALDFDTWMANPRNIIEKLPKEAVFELGNGHLTPNPEHPDGFAYFEHVLRSLLEMYPQIDQLSVWHRRPSKRPGLGTIWMNFPYEQLPNKWKNEYLDVLKEHPEIEDCLEASSMFAYSKVVNAIQKARDALKPELEISSGSWQFHYIKYADAFMPRGVAFLPLDWQVVFDQDEAKTTLAKAGANRDVYPVIWAHHDDHRYIGRPYTPWENLSTMLQERNSKGFGIIHWTTRPLDLYFSSSARQVWKSTENEVIQMTVNKYVMDLFGKQDHRLSDYYYTWLTSGPMFGRETSDHFIDLGKQTLGHGLESWEVMKVKTLQRLEQFDMLPGIEENNVLKYQKQMEEFYLSFFENQILFQQAFELADDSEIIKAAEVLQRANPDETIKQYVKAVQNIGFTSGEKALVFSMNTRWLADFYNLEQRLGMQPVRFLFSPTQHDSLAQAPGHFSYHIDDNGDWWRCLWENEMKEDQFANENEKTTLVVGNSFDFYLRTMHGQPLANGIYKVDFIIQAGQEIGDIVIEQVNFGGDSSLAYEKTGNHFSFDLDLHSGDKIKISGAKGLKVVGIVISRN